jgi:hypothetical protein
MNHLEKLHARPGDRPGAAGRRAAQSAGIAPATWTRWRNDQRHPSAVSLRKLEGAYARQVTLPQFRRSVERRKTPDRVNVTAIYQWSGSTNHQSDRNRMVRMTGMRTAMRDTIKAWISAGPQAAAEAFQWGASRVHGVAQTDDTPPQPGIQIKGDHVIVEFP